MHSVKGFTLSRNYFLIWYNFKIIIIKINKLDNSEIFFT